MEKIKPPQPIPYPTHPILKSLYRLPILLYRLGLGPLIGKNIIVVSTYGRKTGKIHRTPVEYYQHQGQIFVMSGFMDRPDWFQNLRENPQVGLNIKNQRICARGMGGRNRLPSIQPGDPTQRAGIGGSAR